MPLRVDHGRAAIVRCLRRASERAAPRSFASSRCSADRAGCRCRNCSASDCAARGGLPGTHRRPHGQDRKSVVEGKSVSVRLDLGGRRLIKKKYKTVYKNRKHSNKKK